MQDQINGHDARPQEQEQSEEGKPEFPFVRNAIANPDGSTTLVYNFKNGHFAGMITFRTVAPQVLAPMAEDFRHVVGEIEAKIAEMAKAAAASRDQGPKIAVAGADTLGKLKPRQ